MTLYGIILHDSSPEKLSALILEYLIYHAQPFLASRSFDHDGFFASLQLVKNDKDTKTCNIRIPIQYILSVVELESLELNSIGFLS